MNKIAEIKKRRKELDSNGDLMTTYKERQERLRELVEVHGVEAVAVASNLSEVTVKQYCRTRVPSTIGERPIHEAESILKGL